MKNDLKRQLETLIDKDSLQYVLSTIAEICHEKAEHLRENWQDNNTAKIWDKAGNNVAAVLSKVTV